MVVILQDFYPLVNSKLVKTCNKHLVNTNLSKLMQVFILGLDFLLLNTVKW